MVVVEREHPVELLGRRHRLGADRHEAVGRLPRAGHAAAATRDDDAVLHPPRCVSGEPSRERERVGTARADVQLDHVRERTASPGHGSKSVLRPARPRPSVGAMTRRLTPVDLLLGLLVLAAAVLLLTSLHGHATHAVLADPARTPGVLNPDVTQANIRSTICRHGWTATIRPPVSYTNALKAKQMRAYGETGSLSDYQEDHLISLELGGHPTDPRNLWPEPYPRAAQVDRTENELNAEVCSGRLTLAEAQQREDDLKHTQG